MPYYIKYLSKYFIFISGLHIILGYLLIQISNLSTFYAFLIVVSGCYEIIKSKDKYNQAAIFSGYLVGIEIVLRMTGANVIWEFGKYGVILFMIVGMVSKNIGSRNAPILIIIFLLSLLPSVVLLPFNSFNEWRKIISFNLSGPLTLFISIIYFRGTFFSWEQAILSLRSVALPILTLSTILILRLPSANELVFSSEANLQFSGGYGPNQVSSMLGVLILIIGICKIYNFRFFNNQILDYSVLGVCVVQAFLTFSRGGIVTAVVSLFLAWLVSIKEKKTMKKNKYNIIIIIIIFISLWNISSDFTGGLMEARYKSTFHLDDSGLISSSSRVEIMLTDLEIFFDNLMIGVGPGMAKYLRMNYTYGKVVSAHSEFTRILAEHGLIGLIGILSLSYFSFKEYIKRKKHDRIFFMSFFAIASLTMLHSAMRLAMPGYFFGFAYIYFNNSFLKHIK